MKRAVRQPPNVDRCIGVTAGVIVRAGRVLVCQRRADGHHPGKWEFPGGKVEAGETLEVCLRRELHEELGIDATIGRVVWETRHRYPGRAPIALTFLLVPRYVGSLSNCAFAAIRWAPVTELGAFDFLEADHAFVEQLMRGSIDIGAAGR